jgi:PAP2 superfamily
VPVVNLSWQLAAVVGVALLTSALLAVRSKRRLLTRVAPFVRETGVITLLYALWVFAGTLSLGHAGSAYARARWIVAVEHSWHLPSEAAVQPIIVAHPLLAQACNIFYATMHTGALIAVLIWLFIRHRDRYGEVRSSIILVTLVCLLIQLIPVAPPRLLPGFVDTAAHYGQSVYRGVAAGDQLAAMPSVHVAWALLVALAVVRISTSPWRWLALVHPALTCFVIVATANHFWLDGVLAIVVLAVCELALRAVRTLRPKLLERLIRLGPGSLQPQTSRPVPS